MPEHCLAAICQDVSVPEHLALFGPAAVRELEESGKVTQTGERRGARYALAEPVGGRGNP
jgi:hypothetical protein